MAHLVGIDPSIFKAYDIRGIVDRTLTHSAVRSIGAALGSLASENGVKCLAVGRDGRLSGPALRDALIEGIVSTGADVIDIGMVPTPVLYFATHDLKTGSGVSITGSHNPPEYNGLKMMMAGATLHGDGIQALRQRIEENRIIVAQRRGQSRAVDVVPAYLDTISADVKLARPMKIAIDCGNGVAGAVAPEPDRELQAWTRRVQNFMRDAFDDDLRRHRVWLEDKEAIVALHWRGVPDEEGAETAIRRVADRAEDSGYRTHWGRKVLEIRPPVRIDKGAGIVGLLRDTDLVAAVYVGDDMTDIDAFRGLTDLVELGRLGTAVRVGVRSDEGPPALREEADAMVEGTDGVRELLRALLA